MTDTQPQAEFHDGYRSVFGFDLQKGQTVSGVAEKYVRDWLRSRRRGIDREALDRWDGHIGATLPSGTRVERVEYEDARSKTFAVRYRVTDEADAGHYRVSVSAATDNSVKHPRVAFVISVSRSAGDEDDAIAAIHPPRIVSQILNEQRVFDGATRLQGQPRVIHADDVDELVDAIADPSRQVSLLVASSLSAEADERWRSVVEALTRTSVGAAAIYSVSDDAVEGLNKRLPEPLHVRPGHLRTIAPKVNFENPDARRHPLLGPEQIAEGLNSAGIPTEDAVAAVAKVPRKRLLDAPFPSSIRRAMDFLDKRERALQESVAVDQEVRDVLAAEGEASVATPDQAAAQTPTLKRLFPRRAERHQVRAANTDFWHVFSSLLARWLDKPAEAVTEQTVEQHIAELDQRIIRDRKNLAVKEDFLARAEADRSSLRVEVAELREEGELLTAELESVRSQLAEAQAAIGNLHEQLEGLQVQPAVQVIPDDEVDIEPLKRLQAKLQAPVVPINPQEHVDRALKLLASRLGPIIQDHLEPRLKGTPWTRVLVELDVAREKRPGLYSADDPAAQLRMLTERLGRWGYPFDGDGSRAVSTEAQQLRDFRKRWAHHLPMEDWDAVRAYDSLYRLLDLLGDDEGAGSAREMRDQVLADVHSANGAQRQVLLDALAAELAARVSAERVESDGSGEDLGSAPLQDHAEPSDVVLVRNDASATPLIGDQRVEYEPWRTVGKYDQDLLDRLTTDSAKQRLAGVVEDIVDVEGPVELRRLLTLVVKEFNVSKLHRPRERTLRNLVRRMDLVVDEDDFVWPASIDRESWRGFRPNSSDVAREFTEISPVEIRNAAAVIRRQRPGASQEEFELEVLSTFGRSRRTKPVADHLAKALAG